MIRDKAAARDLWLKEGFSSREKQPFQAEELVEEERLKMLDSRGINDGVLSWRRREVIEIVARWNR